jgi:hypothetical protein
VANVRCEGALRNRTSWRARGDGERPSGDTLQLAPLAETAASVLFMVVRGFAFAWALREHGYGTLFAFASMPVPAAGGRPNARRFCPHRSSSPQSACSPSQSRLWAALAATVKSGWALSR